MTQLEKEEKEIELMFKRMRKEKEKKDKTKTQLLFPHTVLAKTKKRTTIQLSLNMLNRHGLICGATGTGKTITLQRIAELLSDNGIPSFLSDIKGDLSGISSRRITNDAIEKRWKELDLSYFTNNSCPTLFWDVFGKNGHPVRTTIESLGANLLSRILNLNETQSITIEQLFKIAKHNELDLCKIEDLLALTQYVEKHSKRLSKKYGRLSPTSLSAIQRSLILLDSEAGEYVFGLMPLRIKDIMRTTAHNLGIVSILDAQKLIRYPRLYAVILVWILMALYEELPEVGDVSKPKLVLFFDEAHYIFEDAPKILLDKLESVIRLIRSKGVGIFFITQNPTDIPPSILAQLGNRIQHSMRVFTAQDAQAVKLIAKTFRQNPKLNIEEAISQLKTGEALVSVLDEEGMPSITERAYIIPPTGMIGPVDDSYRQELIHRPGLHDYYATEVKTVGAARQIQDIEQYEEETGMYQTNNRRSNSVNVVPQNDSLVNSLLTGITKSTTRSIQNKINRLFKF